MADLFAVPAGKLSAFIAKLSEAGITAEMVLAADTNPEIVKAMAEAAQRVVETADVNPFEMTVDEQIMALRRANAEEGWGFPNEVFSRLSKTAPAWPHGRDSYRSFRIRFGEGDEGVARTFEAHALRARHVYGDRKFRRWDLLRSDKRCLRLLADNRTHKPVVEWITVHLGANRKRKSVEAVRGSTSLADEGLVLAWLFPKRVEAIDDDTWSAWFCAGYEHHFPEGDGVPWRSVPCVSRGRDAGGVHLYASWYDNDYSDYSVPVSGERKGTRFDDANICDGAKEWLARIKSGSGRVPWDNEAIAGLEAILVDLEARRAISEPGSGRPKR